MAGTATVDQADLAVLTGEAQVIHLGAVTPGELITAARIGPVTGRRVLLDTGWSARGLGQAEYFGQAPYLAPDCAQALLDAGTALLGLDLPSVDLDGGVHVALLGGGCLIVENMTGLGCCPPRASSPSCRCPSVAAGAEPRSGPSPGTSLRKVRASALISFYDTSTLPTQEMLDAIVSAPLGDDVYGQDPTVNELEAVAAGLLGKEAAVLMPSGTMANLAAVLSWTRPADEVVLEAEAHLLYYKAGGISGVAGCVPLGVPGERGVLRAEEVERHLRRPDLHYPVTRLLCVENTHNRAGGTITPPAVMKELRELCDAHQLALHVDGARIFNAAVALDIPAAELVADADSVFFALSKGLSAPVGAVLAGSAEFVGRAPPGPQDARRRDAPGRDRRRGRAGRAAQRDRQAPRGPRAGPEPGRQAGRAARAHGRPGRDQLRHDRHRGLGHRRRRAGRGAEGPRHRGVVPAAVHGAVRHPPAGRRGRSGHPGGGAAGDQRPVSGQAVLGLDVGTESARAGLFGLDGRLLAEGQARYPTSFPAPGWAEQDPAAVWDAVYAWLPGLPGRRSPA